MHRKLMMALLIIGTFIFGKAANAEIKIYEGVGFNWSADFSPHVDSLNFYVGCSCRIFAGKFGETEKAEADFAKAKELSYKG